MNPAGNEAPIGFVNPRRNLNSNSGSSMECNLTNVNAGNICSGRRKSLNYQSQLSLKSNGGDGGTNSQPLSSTGRFSPHPNEIFLPQSARLTIPPIEKFDDALINGCLPPPSPAPNSDCVLSNAHVHSHGQSQSKVNQMQQLNLNHFQHHGHAQSHTHSHAHVYPLSSSNSASSICTSNSGSAKSQPCAMALTSAESINISGSTLHKHNKYNNNQPHQSVMSPNSKYRLERYREPITGQKAKIMETMSQSSPVPSSSSSGRYFLPPAKVQCDAYSGYLGSTVHTPVKRYVPTPPLASELYTDLSLTTSMTSTAVPTSCNVASSSLPVSTQYVNMPLPYNYRVKCCHLPNDESGHSKSAQTFNINSHNGSSSSSSSSCPCGYNR